MSQEFHTTITSGESAKQKIRNGVNEGANAVGSTMGFQGNLVLISKGGLPHSTKDGISVAEAIFLENAVESLAWETVKEASTKTVDEAADGTTATCVLTQAFLNNSFDELEKGEKSAIEIKQEIEKSRDKIVSYLDGLAIPVTDEMIYHVAKTSANGDEEIAQLITDAYKQAGENGSVGFVNSNNDNTFIEHTEGTLVERGYANERFVNVHSTQSVVLEDNPLVLISNINFTTIKQIVPFLEFAVQNNRELLIISELDYNVEEAILVNKVKYNHRFCIVKPPAIGKKREELLMDLALVCNTEMISSLSGADFTGREAMYLGTAKSVVVTKENTVIVRHDDTPIEAINGKVAELKEQAKLADKNYVLRKNIESRIAKLSGGISMIKVGGITPAEVEEKIARVDDAVGAVRSAKEEGIVAGGGMALFSAIFKLSLDDVTQKSISAPFFKILSNANFELKKEKRSFAEKFFGINKHKEYSVVDLPQYPNGYDVKNFKEVNMFDAGIIDAKKVVKNALINSISASNTLLRSANVLTYKNK